MASAMLFGLYARGGVAYLLGFVALVPWLLALNATPTVPRALLSGWLMSIALVAAVFAWFGIAIGSFTGIGSLAGLLVLLAGAPLLQPQIIAFALVRHLVGRRHGPLLRALAGASAWVAAEWLMPKLLGDTIGHGLYPSPELRQVADLGGAAGITFLLVLVNEGVAFAIGRRHEGVRALTMPLALSLFVPLMMGGYGMLRLQSMAGTGHVDQAPIRIGVVQSNIYDYERMRREIGAYEVVRHVLDTHYAMSRAAVEQHQVDALLWSETVYPTTFGSPKSEDGAALDREILDFVTAAGVPLVFGTYDIDANGEYNAAAFVEPKSGKLGFYRKTDLFLFTEHVPAWLDGPTFRRLMPWTGTWTRGDGARVFPLRLADGREIPVLPMICLDDVNPNLGIDGARLGARMILTMSNDSWFTDYPSGANLHLNVAAFRSIETRLPQVRVTANGISAVIDASGAVIAATSMGKQELLIGEVHEPEESTTLMMAWGNWVGRAGLALLVVLAGLSLAGAVKSRSARSAADNSAADVIEKEFTSRCVALSPAWRIAAALLRLFALVGLAWVGLATVFGSGEPADTLPRMWMFAGLVVAPEAAAWALRRAFAATVRVADGMLVLEQAGRRTEIDAKDITAVDAWTVPIPSAGAWLRLASGQRWTQGIALADPSALVRALVHAGAPATLAHTLTRRAAVYAHVCATAKRWRIDGPLFKFVLFPLVPALPAFRLHQHIAYGGTFGEYYTFGLKAYLIALAIWWASWAIGMVLFAAVLRVGIEAITLMAIALRPERVGDARNTLEGLGRLLFYVGVPAWLLMRVLQ
ncbi:MAG: apolipoprotein N-acyltransferase [Gammaproteobacteria bacterium]|nr:apolipoprotein N-acyltransferase [Gammaproteobacteria bacterium]